MPDEQIRHIVDVARWTGSARNRQPWRFLAVTDQETRRQLSQLGAYAQHVAGAPLVLVLLSADDGRLDTEFDVGRVAQTISLAAHALGLGSCLATLHPEHNIAEACRILRVEVGWLPRHAISIGRPARATRGASAIPVGRLTVDQLITCQVP